MKFRKGDIATIEVVVDSNPFGDGDIRVRQPDTYGDIYVKQSAMTMKRPKIEVGDHVRWKNPGGVYEGAVLSISEVHLWISLGGGEFATVMVGKVERVDEQPEPDVDEVRVMPLADGGANIVTKHTAIATAPDVLFDGEDRSGEAV